MIKNYLKIAWRNLWKNKAFSAINIFGLALGLACSLLIMLWVQDEVGMDKFNTKTSQLYQVIERQYYDHKVNAMTATPGVLANELKKVVPEIQYATEFSWNLDHNFQAGDKILKQNGCYADSDFFKMFDYPLIQGSAKTALNSPVSLAISRKMAVSFFGSPANAIGKILKYENKTNFTVTAVFDVPKNASEKFEYLINWKTFLDENSWAKEFGNNGPRCYFMLQKNANPEAVQHKLTNFLWAYNKDFDKKTFYTEVSMQPYADRYLENHFDAKGNIDGGRADYVHLFSIVALFILIIACINFMNLTTARSVKRAKEIGVRKVVGAVRGVLIRQFIGESLMITAIAVVFALVLIILILPAFNTVTQKQIELPFGHLSFWAEIVLVTIVTGIIAGSYPALFLSSFKPVKVLKGALKLNPSVTLFRKGLVVVQFIASVVLIIGTIIVSKQINYIQTKDIGFNRENLLMVPLDGDLAKKYPLFKDEILKMPGISMVTRSSDEPINIGNGTGGVDWDGKDPNSKIMFTSASVGYDYVSTMQLKLVQGRDFSRAFATDSVGYLINESALKRINYKDPIGKRLTFWGKKGTIIGVLKDFHYLSIHDAIAPIVIRLAENEDYGSALVKAKPGQTKAALASLQSVWGELNPSFQFTCRFADEEYQKMYNDEQMIGKLSDAFSTLAIVISCLGLLGLAMFTAEQRVKEIGIRKVLGASVRSLFTLLSAEFLLLVTIAFVIASPLAWWGMHHWLQSYAYHAPIEWWMFVLAGIAALLITLLTISFQAIKAAVANPVKSLRSE
jgi:ABC-type antimicrobial peptide transport system permease subunit